MEKPSLAEWLINPPIVEENLRCSNCGYRCDNRIPVCPKCTSWMIKEKKNGKYFIENEPE